MTVANGVGHAAEATLTSKIAQHFPTELAQLTPEWVTSVLRNAGELTARDTITDWIATPIGEGIGLLSDLAKLEFTYAAGYGPLRSLVAKFATQNPQNRAVADGFQMYTREVRFYRDLAEQVGTACARTYFCDVTPDTGDMVLLFEDLSEYRAGDQAEGCSLDDAELAIDAVARLHAATWHAENRTDLDFWPRIDGPLYVGALGAGVAAGFEFAMKTFADSVQPEVASAGDRFMAAIPELHRLMACGSQSLVHGDFRLDNFMFGQLATQRPFVMLDMQAPIVTKSIHDIAYLLTQSLPSATRRSEERRLVERYHSRLVEQGVSDYDADQCWADYELAALHCLEYAIVIAGTLEPGNERGLAWVRACLSRSCQTIVDLDLLRLLA